MQPGDVLDPLALVLRPGGPVGQDGGSRAAEPALVEERGQRAPDVVRHPRRHAVPLQELLAGFARRRVPLPPGDRLRLARVLRLALKAVQELVELDGGASLKVTIARWLTPNGVSISDSGLTPKVVLEPNKDEKVDTQLQSAINSFK